MENLVFLGSIIISPLCIGISVGPYTGIVFSEKSCCIKSNSSKVKNWWYGSVKSLAPRRPTQPWPIEKRFNRFNIHGVDGVPALVIERAFIVAVELHCSGPC